jgi:hypothetical protein
LRSLRLTDRQKRLLALLPEDGSRITSRELLNSYFGDEPPLHARPIIIDRMNGIARKLDHMSSPIRIGKSKRAGPRPVEFWIEKSA